MKILQRFTAPLLGLAAVLVAPTVTATSFGPDAADHILTDDINQALYDYVDISATGTVVATGDEDTGDITFGGGGDFYFYGADRTQFRASTNGFLTTDLASGPDFSNDCSFPTWPLAPNDGGGDRIYLLHDDLDNVNVYYQYFDAANPPAGWVGDVSVIQWQGDYFLGGGSVDFEILIFHRLNAAIIMYEVVDQTGNSSTTGIQNAGVTTGLLYECDFAGTVNPGLLATLGTLKLNEIRIDEPGGDVDEFFELTGVPGFDLTGLSLVVLGDSNAGLSGVVEEVTDLTATTFDPLGVGATLTSIGETTSTLGVDWTTSLSFENDDNLTVFLVDNFTGAVGNDLDIDDDGSLDTTPWDRIVDEVGIVDNATPDPANGVEHIYTGIRVGPDAVTDAPFHVQRCADHTGTWVIADGDPANGFDTPSGLNNCQNCGDGIVEGTEACDGDGAGNGGETAACNDDCTVNACGDGKLNTTAGETCDDGNTDNTDTCPDDTANGGMCLTAVCGDSFILAGTEQCDDGNGANDDDCPDDTANGGTCQDAICGDSFVNSVGTIVEDCDDAGLDTVNCDMDCSAVVCGDNYVNSVAGESCEDGNNDNGDDCPDDGANGGTCVAATCGDGFVDTEGGMMEQCDGDGMGTPGETMDCDADCTDAICGDGDTNSLAGEDCDDTAESIDCNDDCTDAACGDGKLNVTAGEGCDDGNTASGDGCDAMCNIEMGMGGMGGMGAGGMGMGGGQAGPGGSAGPGAGGGAVTSSGAGGSSSDDDGGTTAEDGCGCSTPGNQTPNGAASLALLLGLGLVSRRRRKTA